MITQLNRAHQILTFAERRVLREIFAAPEAAPVRPLINRVLETESPVEICGSLLHAVRMAPATENGEWIRILANRACDRYAEPETRGSQQTMVGMVAQVV